MALNKHKKIEYIRHVLEQVVNDSIDSKDDLILIEVALDFIEDIKEGTSNGNPGG
jgi:hypothetical protein